MKAKLLLAALSMTLAACSTLDYKPNEEAAKLISFNNPSEDKIGIYVYRPGHGGRNLQRRLYIDGKNVAITDKCSFFYREIDAGKHVITTESRFGNYVHVSQDFAGGKNYFFEQDHTVSAVLFMPSPFGIKLMNSDLEITKAKEIITKCANLVPDTDGQEANLPAEKMPQ